LSNSDSTAQTGRYELLLEEHVASAHGYNPYDTFPSVRHPGSTARQADLRRLSEWIRTKQHVDELKRADNAPLASGEALDVPELHRTR
jgi:hypothetical protein